MGSLIAVCACEEVGEMTVAVRGAKSGLNHPAMAATALVTRSCVDSDGYGWHIPSVTFEIFIPMPK